MLDKSWNIQMRPIKLRLIPASLCALLALTSAVVVRADDPSAKEPPGPDEALVCFYRTSSVPMIVRTAMYMNGTKVCDLLRREYSEVKVAPGLYTITARCGFQEGPDQLPDHFQLRFPTLPDMHARLNVQG